MATVDWLTTSGSSSTTGSRRSSRGSLGPERCALKTGHTRYNDGFASVKCRHVGCNVARGGKNKNKNLLKHEVKGHCLTVDANEPCDCIIYVLHNVYEQVKYVRNPISAPGAVLESVMGAFVAHLSGGRRERAEKALTQVRDILLNKPPRDEFSRPMQVHDTKIDSSVVAFPGINTMKSILAEKTLVARYLMARMAEGEKPADVAAFFGITRRRVRRAVRFCLKNEEFVNNYFTVRRLPGLHGRVRLYQVGDRRLSGEEMMTMFLEERCVTSATRTKLVFDSETREMVATPVRWLSLSITDAYDLFLKEFDGTKVVGEAGRDTKRRKDNGAVTRSQSSLDTDSDSDSDDDNDTESEFMCRNTFRSHIPVNVMPQKASSAREFGCNYCRDGPAAEELLHKRRCDPKKCRHNWTCDALHTSCDPEACLQSILCLESWVKYNKGAPRMYAMNWDTIEEVKAAAGTEPRPQPPPRRPMPADLSAKKEEAKRNKEKEPKDVKAWKEANWLVRPKLEKEMLTNGTYHRKDVLLDCVTVLRDREHYKWHTVVHEKHRDKIKEIKENLGMKHVIMWMDFTPLARRYSYTLTQGEMRSEGMQMLIVSWYWRKPTDKYELDWRAECFIAEDGKAVYEFVHAAFNEGGDRGGLSLLAKELSEYEDVTIVSDNCGGHYKQNRTISYVMRDVLSRKSNFRWIFTAPNHGKALCDAVSGISKRALRRYCVKTQVTVDGVDAITKILNDVTPGHIKFHPLRSDQCQIDAGARKDSYKFENVKRMYWFERQYTGGKKSIIYKETGDEKESHEIVMWKSPHHADAQPDPKNAKKSKKKIEKKVIIN